MQTKYWANQCMEGQGHFWHWPQGIYIWKLKLVFLGNYWAIFTQILFVSFRVQWNENQWTWCWSHDQDGPPRPYMVKNPSKIFFSRNRWTDFHETWYVASRTPAHHSLFKSWPWVDLDLFYSKVRFGNLGFSIGKIENSGLFQKPLKPCDLKVGRCRQLIKYMKVWEVKVISEKNPGRLISMKPRPRYQVSVYRTNGPLVCYVGFVVLYNRTHCSLKDSQWGPYSEWSFAIAYSGITERYMRSGLVGFVTLSLSPHGGAYTRALKSDNPFSPAFAPYRAYHFLFVFLFLEMAKCWEDSASGILNSLSYRCVYRVYTLKVIKGCNNQTALRETCLRCFQPCPTQKVRFGLLSGRLLGKSCQLG